MASNEEILKRIHAEKVINWNKIFRQNPTIIESAYEAMDAARRDEAVAYRNWMDENYIIKQYVGEWLWNYLGKYYTDEELYTIFKN